MNFFGKGSKKMVKKCIGFGIKLFGIKSIGLSKKKIISEKIYGLCFVQILGIVTHCFRQDL